MKKALTIFALTLFLCSTLCIFSVSAQGTANSAINSAQNALKNCYDAVAQAEAAGANVAKLMAQLNDAATSLSTAQLANAAGDYGAANSAASQCQSKLGGVIDQANALTSNAKASSTQNMLFIILLSLFSLGLLGVGIGAWVILGRRERRNLHGSREI